MKRNKISKAKKDLQKVLDSKNSDQLADKISKGAAGIAITAGVVAAGAALANSENRKKLSKVAKETIKRLAETATEVRDEGARMYPAIQHRIGLNNKSSKNKGKKMQKKR